jgi:hypothetical protein
MSGHYYTRGVRKKFKIMGFTKVTVMTFHSVIRGKSNIFDIHQGPTWDGLMNKTRAKKSHAILPLAVHDAFALQS